ncbi:glycosyltransferase family 2 protein [Cellulomonas chengniuliangii]|uniref:Glycosyltransferase family 2 protein n=2 Tax=Cellulomonas chengniuliangii TaxID=2968084 RepID=A0ABY5KYK4_9CELL|nr:glycosyltransferase family 2 protein [Cellulomonas chengniuliangii]MCC2310074.1 glycosyltransferase family 2 protein [Cellulomonas chengniuliangii]UUI74531.1 glycosyltransferase family 2 protein [Cellulomonas chengniuliangii]
MGAEATAVSVVVPAYQEEVSIVRALQRLLAVLDGSKRPYEVIVVSDGSTDATAKLARSVDSPMLQVLEYEENCGKGHALRTGFAHARHPFVAFIDGDLDLDPVVLPGYLDSIESGLADVVIGSKIHPDSNVNYPLFRRMASRVFRLATRVLIGLNLGDTQTGVKAMRREAVAESIENCTASGFAFDLEFLARLSDRRVKVLEAPVVLEYEFTSTVDVGSILEALRDLLIVAHHRRSGRRRPWGGRS